MESSSRADATPNAVDMPVAMREGRDGLTSEGAVLASEVQLRREQLQFEREKWHAEQTDKAKSSGRLWDGAPLNPNVVVAVVGGLVAVGTAFLQVRANRELERTKYESQLILKALEPADAAKRADGLAFLVRVGLVSGAEIDTTALVGQKAPPQFFPGTQLVLPSVKDVQEGLATLGFYKGPIDDVLSEELRAAVRSYQRTRSLPVDGTLGPALFGHIQADVQIRRAASSSP